MLSISFEFFAQAIDAVSASLSYMALDISNGNMTFSTDTYDSLCVYIYMCVCVSARVRACLFMYYIYMYKKYKLFYPKEKPSFSNISTHYFDLLQILALKETGEA
jgi:hypothetical protein